MIHMSEYDIAIISDRETGLAFKSVGMQPLHAETGEEARDVLREASKTYKIIFITEDLAQHIADVISEFMTETEPIIIEIPSSEGTIGLGKQKMKRITERAVGADILFKEE